MPNSPYYKAELVSVFGHPVAKNPSVVMQEAAFQALNLNGHYLTIGGLSAKFVDAVT